MVRPAPSKIHLILPGLTRAETHSLTLGARIDASPSRAPSVSEWVASIRQGLTGSAFSFQFLPPPRGQETLLRAALSSLDAVGRSIFIPQLDGRNFEHRARLDAIQDTLAFGVEAAGVDAFAGGQVRGELT